MAANAGVMGLGYDANEVSNEKYPNFIDELVAQGVISVKAYSLYLDNLQSNVCMSPNTITSHN